LVSEWVAMTKFSPLLFDRLFCRITTNLCGKVLTEKWSYGISPCYTTSICRRFGKTCCLYFFCILYYVQQIQNYFEIYHTPTCFDTVVSPSVSLWSITCQVTQVFEVQLLVIQVAYKLSDYLATPVTKPDSVWFLPVGFRQGQCLCPTTFKDTTRIASGNQHRNRERHRRHGNGSIAWTPAVSHVGRTSNVFKVTMKLQAGRKWVCNDSRNTTVFGKIPESNYMFRSLIEWAIIRLKQENNKENHIR
jgi:hypothetical protein